MDTPPAAEALFAQWLEIENLKGAENLLSWDQETMMPPRGQRKRAAILATLAGELHRRVTAPELRDALEAASEAAEPGSELEAQVREARRDIDRASAVPADLARALAQAKSDGLAAWQEARAAKDFSKFRPALEHLLGLRVEEARAVDSERPVYDVMLDDYEPGASSEQIARVFEELTSELVPLVRAVADSGVTVDESPAKGAFAPERQLAFGRRVAEQMGFAFDAGRIDRAPHPFCSTISPGDVRLTWRWEDDDFRPALYGIMHEAGHGLYEQGLPDAWSGTPLGHAVSMGVHESQSRLWENLVGRSRAFWDWALPVAHEVLGLDAGVGADRLWPSLQTIQPSLIRVEADETTYNLHIVARFDVERRLVSGDLAVADLPEAWNAKYEELLGLTPPDDAVGVMQDIHWSMGAFGYFPTYALGNLIDAQLFQALRDDLGDPFPGFARGEFAPVLGWLRDKVHRHGRRYGADELVERATGRPLEAADFLGHVRGVAREVYGVQ